MNLELIQKAQQGLSIYDFSDYREFLKALYEKRKRLAKPYSLLDYSEDIGLNRTNLLHLILQGKRNLSSALTDKIMSALILKDRKAKYFKTLVRYNQADDKIEKGEAWRELSSLIRWKDTQLLDSKNFDLMSDWLNMVVHQLALLPNFKLDANWIKENLQTPVPEHRIQKAINLLKKLEALSVDEQGLVKVKDPHISTGDDVIGLALFQLYRDLISQGLAPLEKVPAEQREYSIFTLAIDPQNFAIVREKIRNFNREIMELCKTVPKPDSVYQLNIQFFPWTKTHKDKKNDG